MFIHSTPMQSFPFNARLKLRSVISVAASRSRLMAAGAFTCFLSLPVCAQQADLKAPPVVVPVSCTHLTLPTTPYV